MSADIQQARDVLKKWREGAVAGPWFADREHPEFDGATIANDAFLNPTNENEHEPVLDVSGISIGDARLIVGTAGNPDLLDVLDGMLTTASLAKTPDQVSSWFPRLAAAIIAADDRMTS
ncbi:hypothetical protein [Curtobacterium sp. CFBP9011]|uniref:hypothetical protein n=1 Tax=Curtobacterium sp. CFBP9011 TaxID=3096530 RepID=UPI002A6B3EF9|nr:hypothetical protein [Curtobacterium sp. CFBP9011]MDY1005712.1 hypothetical protein [Curtobacterium sp. CFBP9011]